MSLSFLVKLTSISMLTSSHWALVKTWWHYIAKQQAIVFTNVDPALHRHIGILVHNGLRLQHLITWMSVLFVFFSICFILRLLWPGGHFNNTYELLNLRALKISKLHKNHIFQCMGKIFCVEFQRVPLKFHTKYLTHTWKDVDFIHIWKFKSSLI